MYRPGRLNGHADLMSRLPLPATEEETSADLRLSDTSDVDVYLAGASGVHQRWRRRRGINLGGLECRTERRGISFDGLECQPDDIFKVREKEVEQRSATRTTDEEATLLLQLMQRNRVRDQYQVRQPESPRVYTKRDDESSSEHDDNLVFSGQLQRGLVLHACPMTV